MTSLASGAMEERREFPAVRAALRESVAWLGHAVLYGFGHIHGFYPKDDSRGRTVVFLHGLAMNRASLLPLQTALWVAGHRSQYAWNYGTDGMTRSVERLAQAFQRRVAQKTAGDRLVIVAHSLGGLIARHYIQALGGAAHVDQLVTLATPHRGTPAAALVARRLGQQLLPGSRLLAALDASPWPAHVAAHSIAAGRDLLVPAHSAQAPFGSSTVFPELGHMDLLFAPSVLRTVCRALGTPSHEALFARPAGMLGS